MEDCSTIMAVLIDKRTDDAPQVQEILTKHGCIISTRIGLHQLKSCAEEGLIILHLCGSQQEIAKLEQDLIGLKKVKVNKMSISFAE